MISISVTNQKNSCCSHTYIDIVAHSWKNVTPVLNNF